MASVPGQGLLRLWEDVVGTLLSVAMLNPLRGVSLLPGRNILVDGKHGQFLAALVNPFSSRQEY